MVTAELPRRAIHFKRETEPCFHSDPMNCDFDMNCDFNNATGIKPLPPVTFSEAVDALRLWLGLCQRARRLDGCRVEGNTDRMMTFRADGYTDGDIPQGVPFKADDYNGDVHFHGDTTRPSIERFLTLLDEAGGDYHRVLRPSAVRGGKKPKLNLQGSEAADGFYLCFEH